MKLLHLDSSILGAQSVSRRLSAAVVDQLRAAYPAADYSYRDLAADPIGHLDIANLPGAPGESRAVLDQFLTADIVVIGTAMYNFAMPTQLKAWMDRILVAGETFRYSAAGPEGLAGDKRVIVTLSRGGLYGPGAPAAAMEHTETHIRHVFGMIGITPEFIVAEGLKMGPDQEKASIDGALSQISALAA
jgi:FMN-dependent NADH-azoreductase